MSQSSAARFDLRADTFKLVALSVRDCEQILHRQGEPPGVDAARLAAIAKFVRPIDKLRAWAGEICARYVLAQRLGCSGRDIRIERAGMQKPVVILPAGLNNALAKIGSLDFNISHSGDWAVCGLVCEPEGELGTCSIGVDIEQHQAVDWAVCRLCFTPGERLQLESCADAAARSELFFRLWTLKESYIKACGLGLQIDLQSFGMRPLAAGNITDWNIEHVQPGDKQQCLFWCPAFLENGYDLAVCLAVSGNISVQDLCGPQNLAADIDGVITTVYGD